MNITIENKLGADVGSQDSTRNVAEHVLFLRKDWLCTTLAVVFVECYISCTLNATRKSMHIVPATKG